MTDVMTHGVKLTETAVGKVKALLESEGRDDLRLRVSVQPGGCSGLIYQLFFDEQLEEEDAVVDFAGVEVVVDMMDSRVWDHSGLEAIHKLGARYQAVGKTVKLQHISSNCQNLLKKAGSMVDIIVLPDDPSYHVANLIKSDRIPSSR